jgi:hypothetical protein
MEKVEINKKGVKVTLPPAPRLTLKVVNAEGAMLRDVTVSITTKGENGSTSTETSPYTQGENGLVLFASPGEVSVEVTTEEHGSARAGPWTMKAGQTVDGGTVTLKK